MIVRVGLTGSIGMGKSTTARLFSDEGCPVWDADAAVHRLYARDGDAVAPLAKAFPEAVVAGSVSRERLKRIIAEQPPALATIEKIVHPLVVKDRSRFIESLSEKEHGTCTTAVFDIPLLFETGADSEMDYTIVVSTNPNQQRDRVMARGTMTREGLEQILEKQMPDIEKRERADYVIRTDTIDHARSQVRDILIDLKKRMTDARDCS